MTKKQGILEPKHLNIFVSVPKIHILESSPVSMNKIFDIHLRRNSFFSLPYEAYFFPVAYSIPAIFVIPLNAPLLKRLKSVSVNYLLETPFLITWFIMKTK